jgi:hypothetical protein
MLAALLLVAVACGSDSSADEANASDGVATSGASNEFGFEISMTAKPDSIFTIDDVKSTGWKSSKEFPPTTEPKAWSAIS